MANRQPLGEVIATSFYTVLKAANVSVSLDKMDVIRGEADRLGKRIENEIKQSIIDKLEKIQDALDSAFKMVDNRYSNHEDKLNALFDKINSCPPDFPNIK